MDPVSGATWFSVTETWVVLPPFTVTVLDTPVYPLLLTYTVWEPGLTPVKVQGVVWDDPPSRTAVAPLGFEETEILP
jgi:hypothetical protein